MFNKNVSLSLFLLVSIKKLPLKIKLGSLSTVGETKEHTSCLILSSVAKTLAKKGNI